MTLRRAFFLIRYLPLMVRDFAFFWAKGMAWHHSWRIWGLPCVQRRSGGTIRIGKNFVACSLPKYNEIGVSQPVVLSVMRGAQLLIGDDVGVSGASIVAASSVSIGSRVLIGAGCLISDSDSHPLHPDDRRRHGCVKATAKPIVIEDDVFVGTRAIILKGVRLGHGCVVGAGSVVTKDVDEMAIVAGNPARVVGEVEHR